MAARLPLLFVLLPYAAGIAFADLAKPPLLLVLGLAAILWLIACLRASIREHLLPLLVFLAGCVAIGVDNTVLNPADLRRHLGGEPVLATVCGELLETPTQTLTHDGQPRWMARLTLTALQTNNAWVPVTGLLLVSTPGSVPPRLFARQSVQATGVLETPPGPAAPGLFDYRAYLQRHRIHFHLRASGPEDWHQLPPLRLTPLSDRFIRWASGLFSYGLPEDLNLRLLRAMTLGQRNEITAETYEPFVRSGTMHVFAISGLHIALVAGILIALLNVARVPRGCTGAIVIPLIWAYTAATGWQPSAIRATIMMTIVVTGWALRRPGSVLNSLAGAGCFILAWDPQQLFQASFQLSFCVVLFIVLLVPRMQDVASRHSMPDPFLPGSLLSTRQRLSWELYRGTLVYGSLSAAAWLGVLPLTAAYFNLFSPVTCIANMLLVPLSNAALACNFASLCSGTWLPWLTELFNNTAWICMEGMVRVSHWSADLAVGIWNVPQFGAVEVMGYYGFLICIVLRVWQGRGRWWFWLYCAGLVGLFGWRLAVAAVTEEVTVVARSGSAIVHARRGLFEDSLVDSGRSNTVRFVTVPYLKAQGVNRLDGLFLTHGDLQHVEGAPWVEEAFGAEIVYASGLRFRSAGYKRVVAEFRKKGILTEAHAGDAFCGWEVVHPEAGAGYPRADDGALCLRRAVAGVRLLYMAELGKQGQEALLKSGRELQAEVLVTGLPADGLPVRKELLERIGAKLIVVADGNGGWQERGAKGFLEGFTTSGAVVWRMSAEGWVRALGSRDGLRLRTGSGRELVVRR